MKNINKILGVILTLAILAGSLVMAVPVSAGTNAWTEQTVPVVTAGTDTNIYTVADDGLTMYMWTPIKTNLTAAYTGAGTITVQSTAGFVGGTVPAYPVTLNPAITVNVGSTPVTITKVASATTLTSTYTSALSIGAQVSGANVDNATLSTIGVVYKSVDGGRTWISDGLLPPANEYGNVVNICKIEVCPTSPDNLVATDGVNLYRSINGSKTWYKMASAAEIVTDGGSNSANIINSIDIIDNSGIEVLVGTDKGIGHFITNNGIWKNTLGSSTKAMGTATFGGIQAAYAVAFAPNYTNSLEILAVTNNTVQTFLRTYIKGTPGTWDSDIKVGVIKSEKTDNITSLESASMAFPSDFDFASTSTNRVYVGISGGVTAMGIGSGIYRVVGGISNTYVYDVGEKVDVYSVAYAGTVSSGTVIIGYTQPETLAFNGVPTAIVRTSTNAKSVTSAADWTDSSKNPYGAAGRASVYYAKATSKLYVGTYGAGSAFFKANDTAFTSFNGIGMFEVPNMFAVEWGGNVNGLSLAGPWNAGDSTRTDGWARIKHIQFLKTTDGYHELILENGQAFDGAWGGQPAITPDGIIMAPLKQPTVGGTVVASPDYTHKLLKSLDRGQTWFYVSVPVPSENTMTMYRMVTPDIYWVGWNGYIRSNTGPVIALPAGVQSPSVLSLPNYPTESNTMLLKCKDSSVSTWLYSKDGGATWTILGTNGQWAASYFAKYLPVGTEKAIWVFDSNWDIYKWVLDVSTTWEQTQLGYIGGLPAQIRADAAGAATTNAPDDFMPSSGGYAINKKGNLYGQFWRNAGTTGADWRPIPGTENSALGAKGTLGGGPMGPDKDGNYFFNPGLALNTTSGWAMPAMGLSSGRVLEYTDTTAAAPTLSTPAANAELNLPINFVFTSKYTGDLVNYQLQVARDTAFTLDVKTVTNTSTTKVNPFKDLETGVKYYWRVRIAGTKGDPASTTTPGILAGLMSKWSEARPFTLKTIGIVNASGIGNPDFVSPRTGQTGVPNLPVLTWGVVPGATYNVQISTDATFNTVVDMGSALTGAVWSPAKALDNNKTYFWRVQAVLGGINSDWVAFAFTTAAPPAPPVTQAPPPAVTQAPAPPQTVVVPTPVINVPAATVNVNVPTQGPAPAPATPAYIWVIIVIGAVLVVAVVVLIVRTRRV